MFHNIVYKFTKVDNLGCGQVTIKKFLPRRSDRSKRLLFSVPPLGTRKKILQALHYLEMGFWEKIIQSKTFENTHISP